MINIFVKFLWFSFMLQLKQLTQLPNTGTTGGRRQAGAEEVGNYWPDPLDNPVGNRKWAKDSNEPLTFYFKAWKAHELAGVKAAQRRGKSAWLGSTLCTTVLHVALRNTASNWVTSHDFSSLQLYSFSRRPQLFDYFCGLFGWFCARSPLATCLPRPPLAALLVLLALVHWFARSLHQCLVWNVTATYCDCVQGL